LDEFKYFAIDPPIIDNSRSKPTPAVPIPPPRSVPDWEMSKSTTLDHRYQGGFYGWIGRIKLQGNQLLTCGYPQQNHYGIVIYNIDRPAEKEPQQFLKNDGTSAQHI